MYFKLIYYIVVSHFYFSIGSKGEGFDIKSSKLEGYQPMLCVFDILLLNDEVLTNKSLRDRRKILADVFNPVEGRICLSEYKEGQTKYALCTCIQSSGPANFCLVVKI